MYFVYFRFAELINTTQLKVVSRLMAGFIKSILIQLQQLTVRPHHACAASAAITVQDIRNVEQLAADPNVLDVLARSLAPSIYGHSLIKKGLILLLLGGRCCLTPCLLLKCFHS